MGASLITPDSGNTLIYSIRRYRSPQIIKKRPFKHTLPSQLKCYTFQLLPKQQKQEPRHQIQSQTGNLQIYSLGFLHQDSNHMWAKEAAVKSFEV